MTNQSLINEFIEALTDEIKELKRGRGGSSTKCYEGKFSSRSGNFFIYVFRIENQLVAMDDSPAQIEIKKERYPCQIVTVQGFEVTIGIEINLGEFIPEAILLTNLWYLLDLLKKRYESLLNGDTVLKTGLADKVFDFSKSSTGKKEIPDLPCRPNFSFNKDQENAIQFSLGSEVSFVWGPPGTGKTTTIGGLAASMLVSGNRVLVVSHTNVAVDNALWQAASYLEDGEDYQEGRILRFGTPTPDRIREEKTLEERFPMVIPEKAAETLSQSYREELREIEEELSRLEHRLLNVQSMVDKTVTFQQIKDTLIRLGKKGAEIRSGIEELKNKSVKLSRDISEGLSQLREALDSGALRRFFKGLNPDKIRFQISSLRLEKETVEREIQSKTNQHAKMKRNFEEQQTKAKALRDDLRRLESELGLSRDEAAKVAKGLETEIQPLKKRVQEINELLKEIQDTLLAEARLVATTLTKACISKELDGREFDTIIVDESSMAPMPHLYYAISRATEKACIVGDFRQLPPIAICKESELVKKWLSRDVFEQAGITAAIDDGKSHPKLKKLRDQFRMAAEIAEITNSFFYAGDLVTKTDDSDLPRPAIGGSRLVLYNTDSLNPWASRIEAGSRYNIYNAVLINEIIGEIRKSGDSPNIGVITPYRAHAKLINLITEDSGRRERISTVHRFQGLEQDAVIFDTCEGPPLGVSPLLDERIDKDAKRLLNVAITRPRAQLIVIANVKYLRRKLPSESYVRRLIEELMTKGKVIDSVDVLSGYICQDFERWKNIIEPPFYDEDPDEFGNLYTENNFYPAFFADLRLAKEELIIVSPYLAANRARQFFDIFGHKESQGVKVKVFTQPRRVQERDQYRNAGEVFDEFKDIGILVKQVRRCHQKLAIIDRTIAWEGSLNILSHSDRIEHMRRRGNHPRTCAELIKMHNLDVDETSGPSAPQINVVGISCPECEGKIEVRRGRYGPFLGCTNYPKCKFIYRVQRGDAIETDQKCSEGHTMVIRRGRKGLFLGCLMYPDHQEARPL